MLLCKFILYPHSRLYALTYTAVCPLCSNCLTVSRSSNHTVEFPSGQNRLECRTCPYQFLIDKKYYERKEMKRKEVEDVMGGANAWENVDKADGMFDLIGGVVLCGASMYGNLWIAETW